MSVWSRLSHANLTFSLKIFLASLSLWAMIPAVLCSLNNTMSKYKIQKNVVMPSCLAFRIIEKYHRSFQISRCAQFMWNFTFSPFLSLTQYRLFKRHSRLERLSNNVCSSRFKGRFRFSIRCPFVVSLFFFFTGCNIDIFSWYWLVPRPLNGTEDGCYNGVRPLTVV